MASFSKYVNSSFRELKNNVTWPTLKEAQRLMLIVAIFSVLFSLAIWGVDEVFGGVIKQYFSWVKS
ncbi:preprotein translocase subunit SecE [Psychroflexus maritimus]|uniref:Protein translocase subunit SecE n=1 Tax=Psychroflexus maritimus TaxID=2714865 RepID=A0A967AAL8_9FLAO|nr:preprotein translocase subunit SecE [Psychroflexus maritimus]NGZ88707.1 preprotein translocase subunit SecE [Psychroflexus maritimus]